MAIRPLSKELQAKAIAELNEKPDRIQEDLRCIKEWLSKQKHIRARTDDQWLLAFLRGCKFSLERTKEKLDMYYTMRTLVPEFYKNRNPFCPRIQAVLKAGIIVPLRTPIGADSPSVRIMRNNYDPTQITFEDILKTNMMILDIVLVEDDQSLIAGMINMQDMTGSTLAHITSTPLSLIKKGFTIFQNAYPIRPKAMHLLNIPSFFENMYALIKPLLNEKMQQRRMIHSKLEEIHKHIPKHVLPTEYGGDAGPIQNDIDFIKEKVESYAKWFEEDEKKYGTDESLRLGKPKTSNELFGIEGSFRKLNVD